MLFIFAEFKVSFLNTVKAKIFMVVLFLRKKKKLRKLQRAEKLLQGLSLE
jgi:hypothetical protein